MTTWDTYPLDYRSKEAQAILAAVQAGECVSLVGLSGSGKSNLLGFIAYRLGNQPESTSRRIAFVLVDCNRAVEYTPQAFFRLILATLQVESNYKAGEGQASLEAAISERLASGTGLCLMLDRFDVFAQTSSDKTTGLALASNLRALRDAQKYELTLVTATRRPLDAHNELAELFYANTVWLGPLNERDARWNIERYAQRRNLSWGEKEIQAIWRFSRGYPSILRAACEAAASTSGMNTLEEQEMAKHPAVRRRLEEFFADHPSEEELRLSGLSQHPLLSRVISTRSVDPSRLTAKEHLLWEYFLAHPEQACEKDDLIRAVWPEDRIFELGIRDDSLAQLVHRLREKIEPDPSKPIHIHTLPGRGYRYIPKTQE